MGSTENQWVVQKSVGITENQWVSQKINLQKRRINLQENKISIDLIRKKTRNAHTAIRIVSCWITWLYLTTFGVVVRHPVVTRFILVGKFAKEENRNDQGNSEAKNVKKEKKLHVPHETLNWKKKTGDVQCRRPLWASQVLNEVEAK